MPERDAIVANDFPQLPLLTGAPPTCPEFRRRAVKVAPRCRRQDVACHPKENSTPLQLPSSGWKSPREIRALSVKNNCLICVRGGLAKSLCRVGGTERVRRVRVCGKPVLTFQISAPRRRVNVLEFLAWTILSRQRRRRHFSW